MERGRALDPFGLVCEMRMERTTMVQGEVCTLESLCFLTRVLVPLRSREVEQVWNYVQILVKT